jgi:very-short-patch-repair endonuclease
VDAVWKEHRLVVELDGYEFHRTRAAFERDRRRDAILAVEGYRILRFIHLTAKRDPGYVVATLRSFLAVGSRRLTPN